MREHLRNFFVVFFVFGLAVATLDLLIDNPYSQKLLASYLNRFIASETNLSVSFESISIDLIPIEVNLFGVQVTSSSQEDKDASAEAIQVKVRVSPLSLIFGKPRISLLHIDGLNIRIPKDFKGNFLKSKSTPSKKPIEWPIKHLSLENAQVLVRFSNGSESRLHLAGMKAHIHFKDAKIFQGDLSIGTLGLSSAGKDYFQETSIISEIRLNEEIFSFENLFIQDPLFHIQSKLKGSLSLKNPKSRYLRVNGEAQIDGDVKILERMLDWEKTHGRTKIKTKLFLNIPFSNPDDTTFYAEGFLETFDAYLSDVRVYETSSRFTADNNGMELKGAKITIDKEVYSDLNGTISFNEKVDFDFRGRIWKLPLSRIISSFGPKFEDVDFKLYTDNIAVKGTGDPFKMNLTGQAELANLDFPLIKIARKRYTRTPNCYGNLNLAIDAKRLDFKETDVSCFVEPENHTPNPPKKKTYSPPPAGLFPSILQLREYIDFDEGPHFTITGKDIKLPLAQTYFQIDMGGFADVSTKIYETKHKLSITNSVSVKGLVLEKIPLGDLKASVDVLDQAVEWKDLQASDGTFSVFSPKGSYDWKEDTLSFTLTGKDIPRNIVQNSLDLFENKDLSKISFGIKNLEGDFKIPLSQIPAIDFKFQAETQSVIHDGEEIVDTLKFSSRIQKSNFHFSEITARRGDLEISGELQYKKRDYETLFSQKDEVELSFSSKSDQSSVNHFKDLPYIARDLQRLGLAGRLAFDGKIKGHLSQLGGYFNTDLTQLSSKGYPLYPLKLKSFIHESKAQFYISQPGDSFLGSMDLDLAGKGFPFKLFMNLKQFDLRAFAPKMIQEDARNYAYLTASWSWEGTLERWWYSKGFLKLEDLSLAYFPQSGKNTNPIFIKSEKAANILMSERSWSFENDQNFRLSGPGTQVEMRLVDSHPPKQLGLFIDSSFKLNILPKVFSQVQAASGELFVESSFLGPIKNLAMKVRLLNKKRGVLDQKPILITIPELTPAFEDIQLDLLYENNILTIKELTARKGKGYISLDGHYDVSEKPTSPSLIRMNLDQVAVDANLPYLKTVHSILNGKLIFSGDKRPYKLDGNLRILKAETGRFLDIEGEIIKEYSAHHLGSSFEDKKNPFLVFNLAIEANKSIEIKSRSFTASLSSNMILKGTSEKPILNGLVSIDKGKFRYKRDFTISHGEMIFDNPLRNDPKMNVVARAQIGSYGVTIFITGDSSKPLVDIVVDPPTKDDGSIISRLDAIVLLSTGRLPETETRSQDARGVVVSTGVNIYAAQIPFDKFNELTGQKFISPYVNYTTDDQGTPVPQLNVPIHISDLVEAIIQTIPNKTSATVQVPLHDNISVSGSATSIQRTTDVVQQNDQIQSGVDLKFAFPFK